jgi:tryptophanyl-tRNA synthetase
MKRSLSGIKPTGSPHLGNYLAMIRPCIELQDSHEGFYFIADYHSLTTEHNPQAIIEQSYEAAASFLAFGLDPSKATLFRQSDIPEVTELTWLLSCVTSMGLLERAHAYKAAKDRGDAGKICHGVFAYPVLMASDILIYDSNVVPVGKDQIQHVEITRDIAQRFNHVFGETFVLPSAVVRKDVEVIPGTDGQKMSKSYGNTIEALLPSKKLRKKVMQVVTDSTPLEEPKDPDTCNVFALFCHFSTPEEQVELATRYREGNFGYGHAKQALFEKMDRHLEPFRERYETLIGDRDTLEDILQAGAARARIVAQEVLDRARTRCGLGKGKR